MSKKSIALIVSVDKVTLENEKQITDFFESVSAQTRSFDDIVIVGSKGDKTKLTNLSKAVKSSIIINDSEINNNQARFNLGLTKTECDYVVYFTYESLLSPKIAEIYDRYISDDRNDYTAYLPLGVRMTTLGDVIGLANEFCWTNLVSDDENGLIGKNIVESYADNIFLHGLLIERKTMITYGGLKTGLVFGYSSEFIRRLVKLGGVISVIPKIGYKRIVDLPTEENYLLEEMSNTEVTFWLNQAKTASKMLTDEQFVYEKSSETNVGEDKE